MPFATQSGRHPELVNLTGLYFPLTEARCRFVGVPVVVSDMGLMFPVPEAGILPPTPTGFTRILRPSRIRTCDRTNGSRLNRTDTFMVYYRYDESMMRNISLANLDSNICWRGEVIIMKVGVRGQLVKMASSRDSKRIARFIMTELAKELGYYTEVRPTRPLLRSESRRLTYNFA